MSRAARRRAEREQKRASRRGSTNIDNSVLPTLTPNEMGSQVDPTTRLRSECELGLTPMGLALEGRPPGCVLNRDFK